MLVSGSRTGRRYNRVLISETTWSSSNLETVYPRSWTPSDELPCRTDSAFWLVLLGSLTSKQSSRKPIGRPWIEDMDLR